MSADTGLCRDCAYVRIAAQRGGIPGPWILQRACRRHRGSQIIERGDA